MKNLLSIALALGIGAALATPAMAQPVERRDHRQAKPGKPDMTPKVTSISAPNGAVGTQIVLKGRFPVGTKLSIGKREIAPTQIDERTITFAVPKMRPGKQSLVITAPGGETATAEFTVDGQNEVVPITPGGAAPVAPPVAPPIAPPIAPPADGRGRGHGDKRFDKGPPIVTSFMPRTGIAGTEVTITGRRFRNELTLQVAGQTVAPTKVDDSSLTFVMPAGKGNQLIALVGKDGQVLTVGQFEITKQKVDWKKNRDDQRNKWRKQAESNWAKRQKELAADEAARQAALLQQEEALAAARDARRNERVAVLKATFEANFLAREDVRAEMALNADRTARLARMLRLAETGTFGDLVIRIQVMASIENARHDQRMAELRLAAQGGN